MKLNPSGEDGSSYFVFFPHSAFQLLSSITFTLCALPYALRPGLYALCSMPHALCALRLAHQVPNCQDARYFFCSAVSLSMVTPMAANFSLAIILSIFSGTG